MCEEERHRELSGRVKKTGREAKYRNEGGSERVKKNDTGGCPVE